jgi:hypothetical protein
MREELAKILTLFKSEKISLEDTLDIISTLVDNNESSGNNNNNNNNNSEEKFAKKKKYLIIKSENNSDSKKNFNIKLPISFAKLGTKFIPDNVFGDEISDQQIKEIKGNMKFLLEDSFEEVIEVIGNNGQLIKIYSE